MRGKFEHLALRWSAAVLTLGVSCQCPSSAGLDAGGCRNGGTDEAALEAWCDRLEANFFCDGTVACGTNLQGQLHQDCIDSLTHAECRSFAAAQACAVRLDPGNAEQCLLDTSSNRTGLCVVTLSSAACQNVLTPVGRAGAPCSNDGYGFLLSSYAERSACAEGYCDQGDQCGGTCRAYVVEGEACTSDVPNFFAGRRTGVCAPPTFCEYGIGDHDDAGVPHGRCRRFAAEGESCSWWGEPVGASGRPCDGPTLYCPWPRVDGGTCVRYAAEHEPCSPSRRCFQYQGISCSSAVAGTCERPQPGDSCAVDRPCGLSPPQTCALSGRCELLPLPRGSPCRIRSHAGGAFSGECYPSGLCLAGDGGTDDGGYSAEATCGALPLPGEPCERTWFPTCEPQSRCVAGADGGSRCANLLLLDAPCDPALDSCTAWTRCDPATRRCAFDHSVFQGSKLGEDCGVCDALLECSLSTQTCRPVCPSGS